MLSGLHQKVLHLPKTPRLSNVRMISDDTPPGRREVCPDNKLRFDLLLTLHTPTQPERQPKTLIAPCRIPQRSLQFSSMHPLRKIFPRVDPRYRAAAAAAAAFRYACTRKSRPQTPALAPSPTPGRQPFLCPRPRTTFLDRICCVYQNRVCIYVSRFFNGRGWGWGGEVLFVMGEVELWLLAAGCIIGSGIY